MMQIQTIRTLFTVFDIVGIVQIIELQRIKMYPINGKIIQTRLYELTLQRYYADYCLNSSERAAGSLGFS